ncbi:MAG: helix-turn-helix domain-containing protein [Cellvibrionaceae bacterium]
MSVNTVYGNGWLRAFKQPKRVVTPGAVAQPIDDECYISGATTAEQSYISPFGSLDASPSESGYICPAVKAAIQLRKDLGFTQARFARFLNLSPRTLRDWEQGRRQPSGAAQTLLAWAVDQSEFVEEIARSKRTRDRLNRLLDGC